MSNADMAGDEVRPDFWVRLLPKLNLDVIRAGNVSVGNERHGVGDNNTTAVERLQYLQSIFETLVNRFSGGGLWDDCFPQSLQSDVVTIANELQMWPLPLFYFSEKPTISAPFHPDRFCVLNTELSEPLPLKVRRDLEQWTKEWIQFCGLEASRVSNSFLSHPYEQSEAQPSAQIAGAENARAVRNLGESLFTAIHAYSIAKRTTWAMLSEATKVSFFPPIFRAAFDLQERLPQIDDSALVELRKSNDTDRATAIVRDITGWMIFSYPQGIGPIAGIDCSPYEPGGVVPAPDLHRFLTPLRLALSLLGSSLPAESDPEEWWDSPSGDPDSATPDSQMIGLSIQDLQNSDEMCGNGVVRNGTADGTVAENSQKVDGLSKECGKLLREWLKLEPSEKMRPYFRKRIKKLAYDSPDKWLGNGRYSEHSVELATKRLCQEVKRKFETNTDRDRIKAMMPDGTSVGTAAG